MSDDSSSLDYGSTIRGFSPEQKVFNRYTLKKILGRGGMGVVWLAQDEHLEQPVALKFLPEVIMSDRSALEDLKKETRRSREMTHPHIVRIHDFVLNDQTAAISMEFIEGDTLSNRRSDKPNKVYSVAELRPLVEQMCAALHYAHTKAKVVHRDLKPANLMLDGQGEIKITDFGIARSISDSVSRVSMATSSGTPVYMSPQQMMGDQPGPTDDVYAFGATVYELLTSRPPFHSGNVLLQVREKIPPSMNARRAEFEINGDPIPEVWEKVIASCLSKDPAARPASMLKIAEALGLVGGMNFSTNPPAPPPPPPTPPPLPTKPVDRTRLVVPPPAPKPPKPPRPPRKPMPRWVLPGIGGVVVAALLVIAVIIGPDKWRMRQIDQASRRSQNAANVQDWLTALTAAKEAMDLLKQTDKDNSEYSKRYMAVQEACLASLARPGSGESLFALWSNLSPQIKANLTEEYARKFEDLHAGVLAAYMQELGLATAKAQALTKEGKDGEADAELGRLRPFRVLASAEFDASEAAITSARAQVARDTAYGRTLSEIRAALELAAGGDPAGALAKLSLLAKQGIAPKEIEDARRKVQTLAEMGAVEQLARALVTDDAAAVQSALNDYAKVTGQPVDVTGAALLAEKDFEKFLRLLEQLRMRPAPGAARTNHFDVVVVETLKARFTPASDAARFLARTYAEWAGEELGRQRPGSALLLNQLAKSNQGGMETKKITDSLAQKLELYLEVPLTVIPTGLPGGLKSVGRDALTEKLQAVMGSFVHVVGKADSKNSGVMVASTRFSPLDIKDSATAEHKTETIREGEKREVNPARQSLVAQLTISQAALPTLSRQRHNIGRIPMPSPYEAMIANISQLQIRLQSTPEYTATPNVVTRPYDEVTHHLSFATDFKVEFSRGSRPFGPSLATTLSQTREMVARSGESYNPNAAMSGELFSTALKQNLEREFNRSGAALFKAIAEESLVTVESSSQRSASEMLDLRWGLLQLWKNAGVTLADPLNTERALRFELGLPGL